MNMDIPRELIYEEKSSIKEFDIYDKTSLNHLLYNEWLLNLEDLKPFESGISKRRLKVFNDAYYICTLIFMHPTNEDFAYYAKKRCTIPSVVFPMVYLYISKVEENYFVNNLRLLKDIKAGLKSEGWHENLNNLLRCTSSFSGGLSSSVFAQRKLTPKLLSEIKWYKATGGFVKEDIELIARYISKSEEDWVVILDSIRNAVSDYEWEYNNDLEYFDENGKWCRETPKDMSNIYHFIDEIKRKYNEHLRPNKSFKHPFKIKETMQRLDQSDIIDTSSQISNTLKGRPGAEPFEHYIKSNAPDCFMEILTEMLDGKRGIEAASIINACIGVWIERPMLKSVTNRFKSVKCSAFNEAMKKPTIINNRKEEIREIIKKKISLRTIKSIPNDL